VNPGHAILFVAEGRLDAIEYYNWTDAWPAEPLLRRVFYYRRGPDGGDHESNNRDVEAIAAKLAA